LDNYIAPVDFLSVRDGKVIAFFNFVFFHYLVDNRVPAPCKEQVAVITRYVRSGDISDIYRIFQSYAVCLAGLVRGAAGMEGAHCKLGAGLADRLRRYCTYRFPYFHGAVCGKVASVTFLAYAVFRFAG